MTQPTLVTATDISFATLRAVYAPRSSTTNIRLGDYARLGSYVPSLISLQGVGTQTNAGISSNVSVQGFQNGSSVNWQYRPTLVRSLNLAPANFLPEWLWDANDKFLSLHTKYEDSTSTFYFIRSSGFGSGGTTATVGMVGGGMINFNYTGGSISDTWRDNSLQSARSAAYNTDNGAVLVLDSVGHGAVTAAGVFAQSEFSYSLSQARANQWNVVVHNSQFVAVTYSTLAGQLLVRVSATGANDSWTGYTLTVQTPTGADSSFYNLITAGGRVWLGSNSNTAYSSTDPASSSSWILHSNLATVLDVQPVISRQVSTVAYNYGIWLVGTTDGQIARSTDPAADSWTLVTQRPGLNSNFGSSTSLIKIIAYGQGFLAWGTWPLRAAWSWNGSTWYYGLGTTKLTDSFISTRELNTAHYDPVLDRLYVWCTGGYYIRTDGDDLSLQIAAGQTLTGPTRWPVITLTFNNSDPFALTHGAGFGQQVGFTIEPNGSITQLASGNPSGPSFGPFQYLNPLEPGVGSQFEARLSSYTVTGSGGGFVMNSSITQTNQTLSTPWVNLGTPVTTYVEPSQYDEIYLSFTLEIRRIGTGQVISRSGFAATDSYG